jgi:hypothetical protein
MPGRRKAPIGNALAQTGFDRITFNVGRGDTEKPSPIDGGGLSLDAPEPVGGRAHRLITQIGAAHGLVGGDCFGWPVHDNAAGFEQIGVLRQFEGQRRILLDD